MIRVGIMGAGSPMAGELIRLLSLHPEVELETVCEPSLRGRTVASHHKGLAGESELRFTDSVAWEDVDILFIANSDSVVPASLPENLKIVVIQNGDSFPFPRLLEEREFVPGVSEMFRKPLVRGATASAVLSPSVSVALIMLFPLALHLLLNDSLSIRVRLPEVCKGDVDTNLMSGEIESRIKGAQLSFNKVRDIEVERSSFLRTIEVTAEFDCNVSKEELERIYNEMYDDHNFTYIMRSRPSATEVAGTQKCILYLSAPEEGKVRIEAFADGMLRGGAGDAIHAMNLLFGLYEKTGLSFPASLAFRETET